MRCARRSKYRDRVLWRDGGLRDDRAVNDQCALGWTHADRRDRSGFILTVVYFGGLKHHRNDPFGRACRGDVYGRDWNLRVELAYDSAPRAFNRCLRYGFGHYRDGSV